VRIFGFIVAKKAEHSITIMCRVLEVSRSGFHAWVAREPSARAVADDALTGRIAEIFADSMRTYGSPRVHAELLLTDGVRLGRKRIERLMRQAGLAGQIKRRRGQTTIRVQGVRTAPDLVERDFNPTAVNRLWAADITYIRTWEGWLYLASVMDCYSRRIVGWAMADHMRSELVVDALEMAVARRRPASRPVHHSDQGSQPGLNRSSQQCLCHVNVRAAGDGPRAARLLGLAGVTRLSSRRLARRAGRSGDSRVRAGQAPRPETPCPVRGQRSRRLLGRHVAWNARRGAGGPCLS